MVSGRSDPEIAGRRPFGLVPIRVCLIFLGMAEMTHTAPDAQAALRVFKVERYELRALRRIRGGTGHIVVFDINGDSLRIEGIGTEDAEIKDLLKLAGASYDPVTVHEPPPEGEEREYKVVRADPWGHDRIL